MVEDSRTQIFISCGQKKGTSEVDIAERIKRAIESMGYYGYLAFQEQTLEGLKNNIFGKLESSEYFIFMDQKRERLEDADIHRGSLFCNQELALASYLGLEVLGFQQAGIKEQDGILAALQLNPIKFSEPEDLPMLVTKSIKDAKWESNWKNKLHIYRDAGEYEAPILPEPRTYYHLQVSNRHRSRIARNCFGYLQSITDKLNGRIIQVRTAELKWAGYTLPGAAIMPRSTRELDAFYTRTEERSEIRFSCFSDSSYHMKPLKGPGAFELKYAVISDNFPVSSATFALEIGQGSQEIEFH